jgi:hypothetical protein
MPEASEEDAEKRDEGRCGEGDDGIVARQGEGAEGCSEEIGRKVDGTFPFGVFAEGGGWNAINLDAVEGFFGWETAGRIGVAVGTGDDSDGVALLGKGLGEDGLLLTCGSGVGRIDLVDEEDFHEAG